MSRAEEKTIEGKAPWKPLIPAVVALLFGFGAGSIISYMNYRRMGLKRKAKLSLVLLIPTFLIYVIGILFIESNLRFFLVSGAFAVFLYTIHKRDFEKWKLRNPDTKLSSGWSGIGWGLIGFPVTFGFYILGLATYFIVGGFIGF